MMSEMEIARSVLYAEKVKAQRKKAAGKQLESYASRGYRRVQTFAPAALIPEIYETIRNMIRIHEAKGEQI